MISIECSTSSRYCSSLSLRVISTFLRSVISLRTPQRFTTQPSWTTPFIVVVNQRVLPERSHSSLSKSVTRYPLRMNMRMKSSMRGIITIHDSLELLPGQFFGMIIPVHPCHRIVAFGNVPVLNGEGNLFFGRKGYGDRAVRSKPENPLAAVCDKRTVAFFALPQGIFCFFLFR